MEYPDGRRVSVLDGMRALGPAAAADSTQLVLAQQGGSGGDRSVDQTFWLAPLPPAGPVTFIVTWPSFGMAESRATLDGGAVLEAAPRSQVLWPAQPTAEHPEPAPPPRPPSGWFAEPPG